MARRSSATGESKANGKVTVEVSVDPRTADMPIEVLACRVGGHSVPPLTQATLVLSDDAQSYDVVRTCVSCGRVEWFTRATRNGLKIGKGAKYEKDYPTPKGSGRLHRDDASVALTVAAFPKRFTKVD